MKNTAGDIYVNQLNREDELSESADSQETIKDLWAELHPGGSDLSLRLCRGSCSSPSFPPLTCTLLLHIRNRMGLNGA